VPEKPAEQQQVTVFVVQSKDYRTIYSNSFRLRMGDNDIGMSFSYQTQRPAEGDQNLIMTRLEPVVQDEAEVIVTPRQLKYMSEVLKRAVIDFENRFGEIVLPSVMTAQFELMDKERQKKS
jgi:hypothetical protein